MTNVIIGGPAGGQHKPSRRTFEAKYERPDAKITKVGHYGIDIFLASRGFLNQFPFILGHYSIDFSLVETNIKSFWIF